MSDFRLLQLEIELHLKRIEKLVGNKYKLTLVARYTQTDLSDADIVLTTDDLGKAVAAINRLAPRDPAFKPGD